MNFYLIAWLAKTLTSFVMCISSNNIAYMSAWRIERAANITTLGSQEDLNKYLRKHVKLNKEVWDIAWMKKPQLRFKLPMKTGPVNTTVNIIHNRINKAGSTSMMGRGCLASKYSCLRSSPVCYVVKMTRNDPSLIT